ncbi:DUF4893 domain-containing protein [Sphingomicrobium clamense]|uniref:DUF4893 domain-containing protein n=1 Tax=Sphingomicrobium clamense TaxID=2851013 RepID=A0ABS6V841_9SPHN|nr:DUF4893 domain-containing protein [Sphingomicrobium sp. B8]MBW0145752.1 DUF4893 domain-containing protein [Sphingomicrobium sp. B8]
MRFSHVACLLCGMAFLGGCAPFFEDLGYVRAGAPVVTVEADDPVPENDGWDAIVSVEDRERLSNVGDAWDVGLAVARQNSFTSAIENEGELLNPGAALPRVTPTPGSYRCRLVKLGAAEAGDPEFIAYQPFFCYIEFEDENFTIVKQTGTQRPSGRLYPLDDEALVFLGSLSLGNERDPVAYGDDPTRDMAGRFERIGPFRWRLVIPYPRNGGTLDIFELTPTIDQPE